MQRQDAKDKKTHAKKPHDPKMFSQSVTVNVTVNEKDDGLEEAAKGCFKCCLGIGKAAIKP